MARRIPNRRRISYALLAALACFAPGAARGNALDTHPVGSVDGSTASVPPPPATFAMQDLGDQARLLSRNVVLLRVDHLSEPWAFLDLTATVPFAGFLRGFVRLPTAIGALDMDPSEGTAPQSDAFSLGGAALGIEGVHHIDDGGWTIGWHARGYTPAMILEGGAVFWVDPVLPWAATGRGALDVGAGVGWTGWQGFFELELSVGFVAVGALAPIAQVAAGGGLRIANAAGDQAVDIYLEARNMGLPLTVIPLLAGVRYAGKPMTVGLVGGCTLFGWNPIVGLELAARF
ncbi:MAG: hypothetical protein JXB32_09465 [Deltaproteobacteria bacterium]|nr:hypothetical protein [Deltaproteobacteria bacterium]